MAKRVAVIGLGRLGTRVAEVLVDNGADVIAVDREPKLVDRVKDIVSSAVAMDCTDEEALRMQEIHKVDIAVVAIGDSFETNVLTVALLKKLGVPYVVGRAGSEIQEEILIHTGADRVTFPEKEMGDRVAHALIATGVKEFVTLGDDLSLVFIRAPKAMVGTAIRELDLRGKYRIQIIAIQNEVSRVSISGKETERSRSNRNPQPDDVIEEGSTLLISGHPSDISKFTQKFAKVEERQEEEKKD